jgi:hypothetical protein
MTRLWRCLLALAVVIAGGAASAVALGGAHRLRAAPRAQPGSGPREGPASPPPEVASYVIEARYDAEAHTIVATQRTTYVNRTETAIPDLVFHLYLNAFRSPETLWMREAGPAHRGYLADGAHPGWITVDAIRLADGTPLTLAALDADETLVRAELPAPVDPGTEVVVEMTFTAQLPRVFARTGWADDGDFVMAGQWFPKFGVWEQGAWNAHPFRANSEFYADFGSYEVSLTVPQGWVVGATGIVEGEPRDDPGGTTTWHFRAEHVIDFAWGASPHFRTQVTTVDGVRVELLHYARAHAAARRVMRATVDALALYSDWYGPYGGGLYPELTVILVPEGAGGAGGMEYPTLFTVGASGGVSGPACLRLLEVETVHELAHQWFQSLIATNEVEAPWLDEGFADYSTTRAMEALAGGAVTDCGGWTLPYLTMLRWAYVAQPETPMAGTAWELGQAYVIATYAKPTVALATLQRRVGDEAMLAFLGTYARRYAFTHPSAVELRAVMEETLGAETAAWFFDDVVESRATLDARVVAAEEGTMALTRDGDLCVPVRVRVEEGARETILPWPCDEPTPELPDGATMVEIDTEGVALLDLNLANNGLRRQPDRVSWLGAMVRAVRILQLLFGGGG